MDKLPSAPPLVAESELTPILASNSDSKQPATVPNYEAVEATSINDGSSNLVIGEPYLANVDKNEEYLVLVRRVLTLLGFIALVEVCLTVGLMAYIYIDELFSLTINLIAAIIASCQGLFCLPSQHKGYYDYRDRGVVILVMSIIIVILAGSLKTEYSRLEACVATLDIDVFRYYGDKDYFDNAKRCIAKIYYDEEDAIGDCTCVSSKLGCLTMDDMVQCNPMLSIIPGLIIALFIISIVESVLSLLFVIMYMLFMSKDCVPVIVTPVSSPTNATSAVVVSTPTPPMPATNSWSSSWFSGYRPQSSSTYCDTPVIHHRHSPVMLHDHHDDHHDYGSYFSTSHGFDNIFGGNHHDHNNYSHHNSHNDSHYGSHHDSHHGSHHDW